jgi:hypothetical protein
MEEEETTEKPVKIGPAETAIEETLDTVDRVTRLREDLRNGRNTGKQIGGTGQSAGGYRDRDGGTAGHGPQDNGRVAENKPGGGGTAEGNSRHAAADQRGPAEVPQRVRRSTGRPGSDNSSPANHSEATGSAGSQRIVGRLETNDPIPFRQADPIESTFTEAEAGAEVKSLSSGPKYKEHYAKTERNGKYAYYLIADRTQVITPDAYKSLPSEKDAKTSTTGSGSGKTEKSGKISIPFLSQGRTLSAKEAEELLEPLAAAMASDFEYLDKGIALYSMQKDMEPIWGDMADEEVMVLAKLMIRGGLRSPEAATAVRTIVDSDIYIQVGMITVPRAIKMVNALKASPRPGIQRERRESRRRIGRKAE